MACPYIGSTPYSNRPKLFYFITDLAFWLLSTTNKQSWIYTYQAGIALLRSRYMACVLSIKNTFSPSKLAPHNHVTAYFDRESAKTVTEHHTNNHIMSNSNTHVTQQGNELSYHITSLLVYFKQKTHPKYQFIVF